MSRKKRNESTSLNKSRLTFAMALVCFAFLILITRLAYIQVINNDIYKKKALAQHTRDIVIPAKRGIIYDANGVKLAYSVATFDVYLRPSLIKNKADAAKEISTILGKEKDYVLKKLNSDKDLIKIATGLSKSTSDLIKNKKIYGVWIAENNKRVYPFSDFASHILGHTTTDNVGISGIEYYYEDKLKGKDGMLITSTDVVGRPLPYSNDKVYKPTEGENIVLTIDEVIQHFTEKAVRKAYEEHNPLKVSAIVMEPKTGKILAMASVPDYDPNNPRDLSRYYTKEEVDKMDDSTLVNNWNEIWRNPAVSDTYEPGSLIKLLVASAALEENITSPSTKYFDKGYIDVYGTRIYNWRKNRPFGEQTLTEALENSINPIFVQIGQELGKDNLYKYYKDFGLFNKTKIDLPAEASSLYLKKNKAGPVDTATMSYGHGLSTTPIQVVTALSSVVNGGKLMKPYVVDKFVDNKGNTILENKPTVINNVVSEKTSIDLRLMMESVVLYGSGKKAYIPGIRVGGKTGTSEKLINGVYSHTRAYSSFFGVAPIENPKISVLIVVDDPKDSTYGSVIAAPIAKDIMEPTLRYLKVEPNFNNESKSINMPNFVGKTLKISKGIAKASGLILTTNPLSIKDENLIVKKQFPYAGTKINEKTTIVLSFGE
ncbi:penicillin-binding transpeptidase domain-containing protein [Helicovermis profundi]|uniref:Stage V sporulation protein D n=1 Tax=Helicovermis profundi TaxID=3065157 RepID=A0AAU9E7U8_9FIRM|nr:stage V sporulation protein D [Clostridia bacterium S502]